MMGNGRPIGRSRVNLRRLGQWWSVVEQQEQETHVSHVLNILIVILILIAIVLPINQLILISSLNGIKTQLITVRIAPLEYIVISEFWRNKKIRFSKLSLLEGRMCRKIPIITTDCQNSGWLMIYPNMTGDTNNCKNEEMQCNAWYQLVHILRSTVLV